MSAQRDNDKKRDVSFISYSSCDVGNCGVGGKGTARAGNGGTGDMFVYRGRYYYIRRVISGYRVGVTPKLRKFSPFRVLK